MKENRYSISTDSSRFDLDLIHDFLTKCYWAEGIPRDVVQRSIENALCFGVFEDDRQVGFARVISDYATYAYVGDVFILESHRGRGLGKQLMRAIMSHPRLQNLRRWSLVTQERMDFTGNSDSPSWRSRRAIWKSGILAYTAGPRKAPNESEVAIKNASLKLTRCLRASCYARRKLVSVERWFVRRGNAEILRAKRNLA